jgi:YVTN family beta-propeller protein
VAITPDGAHVYVTNFADGTVSVLDTATNMVVATVPVGMGPVGVAITPSPLDQMNTLMAAVQTLITAGTLNGDQGAALLGPLQSAEAFLTQGRPLQAINQMEAFITNVTSLLNSGVLTPRQAQLLIHEANAVIHALGG